MTLQIVAEMVDQCFDTCVYNFRTRNLDHKENDCVYTCADKYFRVAARAGAVMTEQTILHHANQVKDMPLATNPGVATRANVQ